MKRVIKIRFYSVFLLLPGQIVRRLVKALLDTRSQITIVTLKVSISVVGMFLSLGVWLFDDKGYKRHRFLMFCYTGNCLRAPRVLSGPKGE